MSHVWSKLRGGGIKGDWGLSPVAEEWGRGPSNRRRKHWGEDRFDLIELLCPDRDVRNLWLRLWLWVVPGCWWEGEIKTGPSYRLNFALRWCQSQSHIGWRGSFGPRSQGSGCISHICNEVLKQSFLFCMEDYLQGRAPGVEPLRCGTLGPQGAWTFQGSNEPEKGGFFVINLGHVGDWIWWLRLACQSPGGSAVHWEHRTPPWPLFLLPGVIFWVKLHLRERGSSYGSLDKSVE